MRALDRMDVRDTLVERIGAGVPFLGICLGLQALFETSEEAPGVRGLGIFPGAVKRFPADARVPHMGWNELEMRGESTLLANLGADGRSYTSPILLRAGSTNLPRPPARTQRDSQPCWKPATSSACNSIPKNRARSALP